MSKIKVLRDNRFTDDFGIRASLAGGGLGTDFIHVTVQQFKTLNNFAPRKLTSEQVLDIVHRAAAEALAKAMKDE